MVSVAEFDPEVAQAIQLEGQRQRTKIELIASENFTSKRVMEVMGNNAHQQVRRGLPRPALLRRLRVCRHRRGPGDQTREGTVRAEHANVQPHSGAQANTAVYFAFLSPGDTILGMNLAHGGHLTHGSPVNISGKYFRIVPYGSILSAT